MKDRYLLFYLYGLIPRQQRRHPQWVSINRVGHRDWSWGQLKGLKTPLSVLGVSFMNTPLVGTVNGTIKTR